MGLRFCHIFWLSAIVVSNCIGQNLISNGSFESHFTCPNSTGQVSLAAPWSNLAGHEGSADYFHQCATISELSVPQNKWGFEEAATGNAYVGLSLIYSNLNDFREYIATPLNAPMAAGVSHSVSFKYALADSSSWTTRNLGLYFSKTSNIPTNGWNPVNASPQFKLPDEPTNKTGWTEVTFEYTASGGEVFLVIGNFSNDLNTPTTTLGNFEFSGCYIYLDDFEIVPCTYLNLGPDTAICAGATLTLFANDPNATYQWQDNSTGNTFLVDQPGTYWVEVISVCATIRDSITIALHTPPVVDLGTDTLFCQGTSLRLDVAQENVTYHWQDNSAASGYTIRETGRYWVMVEGPCDVVGDTVDVVVKDCNCDVFVPNVFTPNADGVNDTVIPRINCPLVNYTFVVFNRWGTAVFETDSPEIEWDGFIDQTALATGVYPYYMKFKSTEGFEGVRSGSITLLR
jgi:gliding motility-associated-like protein